jgi:hypothetical protein
MTCSVEGCDKPVYLRGMCCGHYQKWVRSTPPEARPVHAVAHAAVVGPFGGIRPFCRAVGIDPVTYYRWRDVIPATRHEEILAGAARAGVDVEAVRAALVRG